MCVYLSEFVSVRQCVYMCVSVRENMCVTAYLRDCVCGNIFKKYIGIIIQIVQLPTCCYVSIGCCHTLAFLHFVRHETNIIFNAEI